MREQRPDMCLDPRRYAPMGIGMRRRFHPAHVAPGDLRAIAQFDAEGVLREVQSFASDFEFGRGHGEKQG